METSQIGPSGEMVDTPRHRALGSASRVTILRIVRASPDGLTTGDVAQATGLHLSTVRAHLDRLAEVGLLLRQRAGGGVPGRPAWRYRSAAQDPAPAPYRALAAALLQHVDEHGGGPAAAARVGRGWGLRLGADNASGGDPAEMVLEVLDGLGFAPARQPGATSGAETRLYLHACPFLELVAANAEAMCGLHEGMIHGVLAAHSDGRRAALEPFGAPNACVVRLSTVPVPAAPL